jgi:hypothetical protein
MISLERDTGLETQSRKRFPHGKTRPIRDPTRRINRHRKAAQASRDQRFHRRA